MGRDTPLSGKRLVITGASRGIGRAAALACAAAGSDLVINGRDEAALEETRRGVAEHGVRCEVVAGSVADFDVCEQLISRSVEAHGGIDCLFNNAGITRDRTLGKMSEQEFDEVIAVNLRGTWACGKLAAAAMREDGGSIVNVVSNTAFQGAVGQTNYAASKAGVAGMTRTWTRELSRYGIRVNAIWPIAETDMTRPLIEVLRKARAEKVSEVTDASELGFGQPEDIARIVVFLASDASLDVNGQVISFNGSKLALWSHPTEVVSVIRDRWTLEALEAEFRGRLAGQLQPLSDAFG